VCVYLCKVAVRSSSFRPKFLLLQEVAISPSALCVSTKKSRVRAEYQEG
jgi:hypothetical protein